MSQEIQDLTAYLLCRYADQSSIYSGWMDQLPCPTQVVTDNPATWRVPDDAGIVITHEHFRWEEVSALRRIFEQSRVPTLVLADGILEYRNTWQNPTIPDASIYQPLMADKIACIGENSARMIQSWGNQGRVEVVGLPRLDAMIETPRATQISSEFKLLVCTATTPAFTSQQRLTVIDSLRAVKDWTESNSRVAGRELQIMWRLTGSLDQEIGVEIAESKVGLHRELMQVDAAITTPSTIYLEALLANLPTAILDFSNSPAFVSPAWSITARDHLDPVIEELANPPEPKMLFQDFVLHDNLNCRTPAADRMVELVTKMMEIGKWCRDRQQPLRFPKRILANDESDQISNLIPSACFPDNDSFRQLAMERCQAELSQAIARMDMMPQELADKNNQISQLQSALDESRRRVADVRSRLFKLRKILGIGKENQSEE